MYTGVYVTPSSLLQVWLREPANPYRIQCQVTLMPSPRPLLFTRKSEIRYRRGDTIGTLAKDPRYRKIKYPLNLQHVSSKLFQVQLSTSHLGFRCCDSSKNKYSFWNFSSQKPLLHRTHVPPSSLGCWGYFYLRIKSVDFSFPPRGIG